MDIYLGVTSITSLLSHAPPFSTVRRSLQKSDIRRSGQSSQDSKSNGVVFNHGRRHGFIDRNPISLVRQSAKRQTLPDVLLPSEINRLLQGLHNRERTLVLLAVRFASSNRTDVDFEVRRMMVGRDWVRRGSMHDTAETSGCGR